MPVGELRRFLEGLDDDLEVVTEEYNRGYGGLFGAGAEVVRTRYEDDQLVVDLCGDSTATERAVAIGRSFG